MSNLRYLWRLSHLSDNEVVFNFSSQGKNQFSGFKEPVSYTLFCSLVIFVLNKTNYPKTYKERSSPYIINYNPDNTTDANVNFNRSLLGTFTSAP